jgi:hypothetical protein
MDGYELHGSAMVTLIYSDIFKNRSQTFQASDFAQASWRCGSWGFWLFQVSGLFTVLSSHKNTLDAYCAKFLKTVSSMSV